MIDLTDTGKNMKPKLSELSSSSYSAINSASRLRVAKELFCDYYSKQAHKHSSNALDLVFLWPVYEHQAPFFRTDRKKVGFITLAAK